MDRRKTIKTLLAGTVATGLVANGCKVDIKEKTKGLEKPQFSTNGQTPEEVKRDATLRAEGPFFNDHELATVVVLSDLIIPADEKSGSATEAGVPEFIDFMMLDKPKNQTLMRGGLKWLDHLCLKKFELGFKDLKEGQQTEILDLIAYPQDALPEHEYGVKFFDLMRYMVGTGFFTSKIGVEDIGNVGNRPNVWDGVPEDVLKKHGLSYDERTLAICVKPEDRGTIVEWDDDGNIIT